MLVTSHSAQPPCSTDPRSAPPLPKSRDSVRTQVARVSESFLDSRGVGCPGPGPHGERCGRASPAARTSPGRLADRHPRRTLRSRTEAPPAHGPRHGVDYVHVPSESAGEGSTACSGCSTLSTTPSRNSAPSPIRAARPALDRHAAHASGSASCGAQPAMRRTGQ